MGSTERLVRIVCYYNNIKYIEFNRHLFNRRIKDSQAIVYHILYKYIGCTKKYLCDYFKRDITYVNATLLHHSNEYNIINHYTKLYENTLTQFKNWENVNNDLSYSIIKTKYDLDNELKYEQILNENGKLNYELNKLKRKSYV